jgi:hypothetical protein
LLEMVPGREARLAVNAGPVDRFRDGEKERVEHVLDIDAAGDAADGAGSGAQLLLCRYYPRPGLASAVFCCWLKIQLLASPSVSKASTV